MHHPGFGLAVGTDIFDDTPSGFPELPCCWVRPFSTPAALQGVRVSPLPVLACKVWPAKFTSYQEKNGSWVNAPASRFSSEEFESVSHTISQQVSELLWLRRCLVSWFFKSKLVNWYLYSSIRKSGLILSFRIKELELLVCCWELYYCKNKTKQPKNPLLT